MYCLVTCLHLTGQYKYTYKSTKNILHQSERILKIFIYIFVFYTDDSFVKKKKCSITIYYVSFGVHFVRHLILLIL